MMVQAIFGQQSPSSQTTGAVLMICIGTAISSAGELHMNVTGVMVMFGSIYFEAVRLILIKKLLGERKLHAIEGLYYIAPISALWVRFVCFQRYSW